MKRGDEVIYTTQQMKDTNRTMVYRVKNNANLDVLQLISTTKKESILSSSFLVRSVYWLTDWGKRKGIQKGYEMCGLF